VQEHSKSNLPEVTIAVVGEDNAGKTSFIKSALDMKSTLSSVSTKKKMSLDGSVYIVRLLEIDLKQVTFDQDLNIVWPGVGKGLAAPTVDGVLLLHDATQPERLEKTVELAGMCLQLRLCFRSLSILDRSSLSLLFKSCRRLLAPTIPYCVLPGCLPKDPNLDALGDTTVPCVLVACKCDQLPEDGELVPIHERHDIYRTSPESPRSQQMCIALVLRSVIRHRTGEF
jgi:hypothetical protein